MAEPKVRRCRPLLGTFVEIAVPAGSEAAIDAAFAAIAHVHARMSFHDERSDLASLRRAPTGKVIDVDAETVAVLRLAAALHGRSGGVFDVTVGARLVASGFLPPPTDVDLASIDGAATDIEILDDTHVRCQRPLLIDLGGIAKGFAVDRAIETLASRGVTRAVVNAGGDLRVLGDQPELVHLREADETLGLLIEVADAALASSANLTVRRVVGGRITTPHLGGDKLPVLASEAVSIVAARCAIADAMTKIALADPRLAADMLGEMNGEIVPRLALRAA